MRSVSLKNARINKFLDMSRFQVSYTTHATTLLKKNIVFRHTKMIYFTVYFLHFKELIKVRRQATDGTATKESVCICQGRHGLHTDTTAHALLSRNADVKTLFGYFFETN